MITVLIGTCDEYSSLWKPFQTLFDRYWKLNTRNLFIGETINVPIYTNTNFETIIAGKLPWGERVKKSLEVCDDYIFFILEDYFFNYSYSKDQMYTWLEDMKKYDINRLQISGPLGAQTLAAESTLPKPYQEYARNSKYLLSVQPSIWKKAYFMNVIKSDYSPWDFEKYGSKLLMNTDHKIACDLTMMSSRKYFNAVRKGFQKSEGWEKFRISENIEDF